MTWIISRLREPSTYASLAGLVASLHIIPNATGWASAITAIGGAIISVAGVVMPESK